VGKGRVVATQGFEERVRAICFAEIRRRQALHGEVLPSPVIQQPILVDGEQIAIFALQRGIHKPRQLDGALAVTTTPPKRNVDAPYPDRFGDDGMFLYHYRVANADTARARKQAEDDNNAVRTAMRRGLPIVYWFGVVPGQYRPFFPAYAVNDYPDRREFSLDLTELGARHLDNLAADAPARNYRAHIVQARMHQARFRQAVLRAYRSSCAICRLKRSELVEAAHIIGDADGGEPVVPNGMALCRLHHAAFDRHLLGIRPDLKVIIREDVLAEVDGPMLLHGLQGFHDVSLGVLPVRRDERPSAEFLERRWERFRRAAS
jgi:putative restriction endonuclease